VSDLSSSGVVSYLLDRKLLTPRAVVKGGLRVHDVSRANRVFVVTAEREPCYVVKLARAPGDAGAAREAAVLERLRSLEPGGPLESRLPVLVAYDAGEGVLILASPPDARDLTAQHARGRFSCALAHEAGRALAHLHAIPPVALDGLAHDPGLTWTVQIHRPTLDMLHTLSAAAVELTAIVQGADELCARLDGLLASWSDEAVIHGDVRWGNCLAVRRSSSNRWNRLQLIDWELCRAGDPGFDIGAFFGDYLRAWLQSIPIVDSGDPGRLLRHAGLPLRRMRPALRAFWDGYARDGGLKPAELSQRLQRGTRFAAVRLLTAALEEAQTDAELRASVLYLLPLADNILRRPDEAAVHLLGLGGSAASQ
jgi:aminoglycoside phosphotransferase (APT) family kinase protein